MKRSVKIKAIKMRHIFSLLFLLIVIFTSCGGSHKNKIKKSIVTKEHSVMDVKNYTGNAFIFPYNVNNRIYIIPVPEKDSMSFLNSDVGEAIKGSVSIQMSLGSDEIDSLENNKHKELLTSGNCNLPCKRMYFSRVFISYKNFSEIDIWPKDSNGKTVIENDSCSTRLVRTNDSSIFDIFHIY